MRLGIFLPALGLAAVVWALGDAPLLRGHDEGSAADEEFLKNAAVGTDDAGLLRFFRKRSLSEADRQRLEWLIRRLGHESFLAREAASRELSDAGIPAKPFLQRALLEPDLEIVRRAEVCLQEIERGPGAALPVAAARLLALRRPAGATEALLGYLPFADDDWVEEEVLAALASLTARPETARPALVAALLDPQPARRAAAAYVLGRSADPGQRTAVGPLLDDPDPKVRLRAAQGLAAAGDKGAVPVLVALLGEAPTGLTWQAEELLCRLAGDQAPSVSVGNGSREARQQCQDAWAAWWRERSGKAPLPPLEEEPSLLGLTILAEMDSNKVWEYGLDGKPRWKLENLQGPIDAHVLTGGRVLIAEYQGQRITERDLEGRVLWEKRIPNGNPIACQRLPNGNTFIATHQHLLEVGRDGKEVYAHTRGPEAFVFGAQRLRNGRIVCISNQGIIYELDALSGRELRHVRQGNTSGGWCSVEVLPGGRFLVATLGTNKVQELDAAGKPVWECTVPGACHATRLANGHTLVASMMNRRVVEVDRHGRPVAEVATSGRPWRVHRR
jgi:hypothetical protein